MIEKFQKSVNLIESNFTEGACFFDGPYAEADVQLSEKKLGITFPTSYRAFLKKYGNGGINAFDVSGLSKFNYNNTGTGGIIYETLKLRKDFAVPNHIITVSDTGDGSYYALDLSQMNTENECPVVIWPLGGYEDTPVLELVAPDFGTWFLERVQEEIKSMKPRSV